MKQEQVDALAKALGGTWKITDVGGTRSEFVDYTWKDNTVTVWKHSDEVGYVLIQYHVNSVTGNVANRIIHRHIPDVLSLLCIFKELPNE